MYIYFEMYIHTFLIFASNQGLDDLVLHKQWACDGTFKCCLSTFYQFYIIHVRVREIYIPRLFALLPNKAQHTYSLLFEKFLELRLGLAPDSVMFDFEKATMNAIQNIFPSVSISGCLFHLCQSIYRKIMELGCKEQYNNDESFSLKCWCLSALAFLPSVDVIDGFEQLIDNDELP